MTHSNILDQDLAYSEVLRRIYTWLLKRTLLLGRSRIFSQAEVEEALAKELQSEATAKELSPQHFHRRQVTEALGALTALGFLEGIEVDAGTKKEDKFKLREDSLGRKLALLNHRRSIVMNIIAAAKKINPEAPTPDFGPMKEALCKMQDYLVQHESGETAGNTLEFVRLHGEFWAALPQTAQLDYWHDVLLQLSGQITLSRIAFPASLTQVVKECDQIVTELENGEAKNARQYANRHLKQFETHLKELNGFLREAEAWEENVPDIAEKEARIKKATTPMRGMIRRIILERRTDYPDVPPLDVSDEQWERVYQDLVKRVTPLFPAFAKKYRANPSLAGQPVIWLIHLTGQLLSDPVELLEISKEVCTKREIFVLEQMAGQKTFAEIGKILKIELNSVIATAQHAKRQVLDAMGLIDGMPGKLERIEALSKDISFADFFSAWDDVSSPPCCQPCPPLPDPSYRLRRLLRSAP